MKTTPKMTQFAFHGLFHSEMGYEAIQITFRVRKTPPKRFVEELPFVSWHFYICPNFGSKICEQHVRILN